MALCRSLKIYYSASSNDFYSDSVSTSFAENTAFHPDNVSLSFFHVVTIIFQFNDSCLFVRVVTSSLHRPSFVWRHPHPTFLLYLLLPRPCCLHNENRPVRRQTTTKGGLKVRHKQPPRTKHFQATGAATLVVATAVTITTKPKRSMRATAIIRTTSIGQSMMEATWSANQGSSKGLYFLRLRWMVGTQEAPLLEAESEKVEGIFPPSKKWGKKRRAGLTTPCRLVVTILPL